MPTSLEGCSYTPVLAQVTPVSSGHATEGALRIPGLCGLVHVPQCYHQSNQRKTLSSEQEYGLNVHGPPNSLLEALIPNMVG